MSVVKKALGRVAEKMDLNLSKPTKEDFGTSAVGLPPLPESRHETYRFYQLEILPDGYPAKITPGRMVAHPIYGSYLIYDYLNQYDKTKDKKFLDGAVKVADATLKRADYEEEFDSLLMTYYEEDALTMYPGNFISGLTQARYLMPLHRVYERTGDEKYKQAARRFLNSLKIPQGKGGVLIDTPYGISVEEYPHEIPTFVLNGWTTIILELLKYSGKANDEEAYRFAVDNIKTVERILPCYDVPQLLTSRYQLTGFLYQKFIFGKPKNCRIDEFSTFVAGEWRKNSEDVSSRWTPHILEKGRSENGFAEKRQLMTNAIFSRIDESQKMRVSIECLEDDWLDFYLANGHYDPLLSSMPTQRWFKIRRFPLKAGLNEIEIEMSNSNFDLLGYPTNFSKKISGKNYNIYHWLHITNFEKILKYYDSDVFNEFMNKWRHYVDWWKAEPSIQGKDFDFNLYKD